MARGSSTKSLKAVPNNMTKEEWETRVDLAAAYQLMALRGWTDLAGTHISARIPGSEDHFLLNPFGMLFDEVTASSLIKVDCDGNILSESEFPLNLAGYVIHSAVHMAKPDIQCVMHTHTTNGVAVAMQRDGLLPLSQIAALLQGYLRYHEYEGAALDTDERERIVESLNTGRCMILRNHGLLTVGESIGEAFVWMHHIEKACGNQIAAMSGGAQLSHLSQSMLAYTRDQGLNMFSGEGFATPGHEWPALLRQLERECGNSYSL